MRIGSFILGITDSNSDAISLKFQNKENYFM